MKYAILRVQKLKTNTAVRGSLKHAFRAQDTPNADPSLEGENQHFGASSVEEAMSNYKGRLPEKVRKNGVRCIEYLMTGSPDAIHGKSREEQDAYFSDCLDWLKEKHGAENVVYAGVHRDETTPHMYAYVVPLSQERDDQGNLKKPGKLNCREFLGGRDKLKEMQTDFAENVGKKHGLERGKEGSRAKHTTIKEYYTRVNSGATIPDIDASEFHPRETKAGMFSKTLEGGEEIKARIMPKFKKEMIAASDVINELHAMKAKAETAQAKAEKSLERFKGISDYTKLTEQEQQRIQRELFIIQQKKELEALKNKGNVGENKKTTDLER